MHAVISVCCPYSTDHTGVFRNLDVFWYNQTIHTHNIYLSV